MLYNKITEIVFDKKAKDHLSHRHVR